MNPSTSYEQFLLKKQYSVKSDGFIANNLNPLLKDFQAYCVSVALSKGRFALFEDCGLGKTIQSLEWSNQVAKHTNKPVLNLAPFAVVEQTINEGVKFGINVKQYTGSLDAIQITNYEQLENIDTSIFGGVVVDESSILKNVTGAYRNLIISKFKNTPFKLACTATPSPNDPMELGNHFEFLNIMKYTEMLATYFVHDGGNTSEWRLKGHAIDTFWRNVSSWSMMFSKPSEIGFANEGYILPNLNFIEHQIRTEQRDYKLFNDVAVSASNFHTEVKLTQLQRLSEVVNIVNNSDESFIVWVEENPDGAYLKKHIRGAIEVTGADKPEYKKEKLIGFQHNEFRVLITKPKIASFGMNYQNCHNMVFASPDYSYEKLYQAIRRELRYGQKHTCVNVFLITTDTMQNVIAALKLKEQQHKQMQQQMIKYNGELYGQYNKVA